ncbi:HlyD family type I secretion periplasmic adaptor subunit [Pseudaminobacter sp. 19-2017]|uniref:Membrane fusion protein (MFP) family protein n=1 Tax=Pseudaminobacter soli (ex Zhang et al. 2022) TaxID=2831468 RepID=A0A942DUH0_9HYPH|nr:HlyD family type I secretion periplasmic adaptor subunit [Pseudaminobacter soli]MBS3647079.1 HlyD family type I secretion periplasmic adaptor subunit [Pseudaminobacter soli]
MSDNKNLEGSDKAFSPRRYIALGYATIALTFGVFGTWAATAPLASGVVAHGMVVVSSNRKTIQHLEGGIISEIVIRDGDMVDRGDVLVRLDPTQAEGNYTVLIDRLALLRATEARLQAESVDADEVAFPKDAQAATAGEEPAYVALQRQQFRDRKATKDGQIGILEARVKQLEGEVSGLDAQEKSLTEQRDSLAEQTGRMEAGQKKGYVSANQLAELMRGGMEIEGNLGRLLADRAKANEAITETKLRILQLDQEFIERASTELRDIRDKISEVAERVKQAQDVLDRTVIRAPVHGMVQNVKIHTKSGVVRPAEPLMEIVPLDDELIINARVRPLDVDEVAVGGTAEVRFPAISGRKTPVIFGSVQVVSPDVIQPDNPQIEPYYNARIAVSEKEIPQEVRKRLQAGMPAEVIVAGGERTMVQYLVRPLTDAFSKGLLEN